MPKFKMSAEQVWQRMRVACIRPIDARLHLSDVHPYLRRMVGVGVGEGGTYGADLNLRLFWLGSSVILSVHCCLDDMQREQAAADYNTGFMGSASPPMQGSTLEVDGSREKDAHLVREKKPIYDSCSVRMCVFPSRGYMQPFQAPCARSFVALRTGSTTRDELNVDVRAGAGATVGTALYVVATKDTVATFNCEHVCYEDCKKDHSAGDAMLEDGKTCIFQNAGAAHSVMPSRRKAFDARRCGLRTWVVG